MFGTVDLASKNLLHDRLRFAITLSGVAFAVTLILVQVGLFMGLLSFSTVTITKLPAQLWVTNHNARNVDFGVRFSESFVNRVRSVPGVERADNLFVAYVDIRLPTGAQEAATIYALEDLGAWHFPWDIETGKVDDLRRGPLFFIDGSADHRYGMRMSVGTYAEVQGHRLQIAGRTRGARSFTTTPLMFMDFRRAQDLLPVYRGLTNYIVIRVAPGASVDAVQAEVARRLPQNAVLRAEDWAEKTRSYWVRSTGLGFNMFVGVFMGCLVAGVIVAQTLYTSTVEHLREFGMVKAMGGSNRDIFEILIRQALIAAVAGFAVGLGPSFLARYFIQKSGLLVVLSPVLLGVVFLGTIVLCLVASIASLKKVANIDPALVFRA